MTDTTDVLAKWDWEIAAAEAAYLADGGDESAMHCIHDLAAEVRALRKEHADAMDYFGSPPKYTRDYGPTLLNQIQGLAGHYEEMMDEEGTELGKLRERVWELESTLTLQEPDATLGRLVREGREPL